MFSKYTIFAFIMRAHEIDYSIWVTQQQLADELQMSVQRIHNWIKRNKIEAVYIDELHLTLVNRNSISIKYFNS